MKNKFFAYSKNENIKKFSSELSPQDYYNTYLGLWYFCLLISFIAQILSLGSEYAYFQNVFSSSLSGVLLVGATVLFCLFIESAKYFVFGGFFRQMFLLTKSNVNPFLLVLTLFISSVSVYASIIGGGSFGIDTAKVMHAESKHDGEIQALRGEIAELHKRNTWQGNTYIAGKDKALLHQKESELSKAKNLKESELNKVASENESKEMTYRYWFAGFEILFVLSTWFIYYFKKRTAIEFTEEVPTDSNHREITQLSHTLHRGSHATGNIKKVGFTFGSNVSVNNGHVNNAPVVKTKNVHIGDEIECEHCGKKIIKKTLTHRFCSSQCRMNHAGFIPNKKKGGKAI